MSQEPNLAEIITSPLFAVDMNRIQKSKGLGSHSGTERREPAAKQILQKLHNLDHAAYVLTIPAKLSA